MVLNPDVQQKAYDQLNSVIGKDRLPQFDDLASLPYIEAMVMELMRWHPVFPLSMILISSFQWNVVNA